MGADHPHHLHQRFNIGYIEYVSRPELQELRICLLGVTMSGMTGNRPVHCYGEELMNERNFALRPEAGPVPYKSLIECQKDAFGKILAALAEARQQLGTRPYHRMSRIFFVSGEPGSGKSSLYFTLREILSQEKSELRKEYEEQTEYRNLIGGLAPAIRWLEPIDLEVAGDEGENLLAAVLVRISRTLDYGPRTGSAACQEAIDQLGIIANDIGIAWDGNLQARASSLDPHSYSQEVMNAQSARLRINERLRKALDKLSNEECYGCSRETLFVLPVDDFYLKPTVSLELLRLLRMISVPRLFFLVMGDEKTMQALFLEKALADWTAIAGPQVFGSLKERQQEVLSRAREMRARYFRKLLPAGQQAVMNGMTWQEALRYKPAVESSSPDVSYLLQMLSGIDICDNSPQGVSKLLDFLITKKIQKNIQNSLQPHAEGKDCKGNRPNRSKQLEDRSKQLEDRIKQLEEGYSALRILEAGPREVLDLWKAIHELKKDQELKKNQGSSVGETPAYLEEILKIVLHAIEEQDFLTEKQQELLRFAFPTGYDAGPVRTDRFELRPQVSAFKKIPPESTHLFVRKHFGWMTHVTDNGADKDKGKGAFSHLPPRQTAWIILLHDLSVSWKPENSITDNLVHKVRKSLDKPIGHEPGLEDLGWAYKQKEEEKDGKKRQRQIWNHFPIPKDIHTFRQLDRLLAIWNDGLSNSDDLEGLWDRACCIAKGSDDCYDSEMLKIEEKEPVNKEKEDSEEESLKK